jgi:LmbE family N-acetylglucosaminyl deacetylase
MALCPSATNSRERYVLVIRPENTRFRLNGKRTLLTRRFLPAVLFICTTVSAASAQFAPAPGTGPGLPETIEAIDSARVTTRILYVTAHPDDESSAVLTYLARGLHADVALLSLTRGEGGQNALGPEQAPQLGLIRTQELLAATRGYGVKLYFTRAKDFGFSKTPEETEKVWGDQVLEDMVRIIRTFRPDVVINNWGGVHGGHGHHQASGVLTPQAVGMAADKNAFPSQLREGLAVWPGQPGKVDILDMERGSEKPAGVILPLDDVSPLWGKTWREIGIDAFASHRTQGISAFLNSPFIRRPIALKREDGAPFDPAELAAPLKAAECRAFSDADAALAIGREALLAGHHDAAIRSLALAASGAAHWLEKCPMHLAMLSSQMQFLADQDRIRQRIEKALALAAGIDVSVNADTSELVRGKSFTISAHARCRAEAACLAGETKLLFRAPLKETKREGEIAKELQLTVAVLDSSIPVAPQELAEAHLMSMIRKSERAGMENMEKLLPEPLPPVSVEQQLTISGYTFTIAQAVTHIAASSTRVDRLPLRIVPAYTLAVEPRQEIEVLAKPHVSVDVFLRVHSHTAQAEKVNVGLDAPKGWTSTSPVTVEFSGEGDRYAKVTLTPPEKLAPRDYLVTAYAVRGGEKFTESVEPLPSLPAQMWQEPALCVVHAFDITVPANLRVGYIAAEGEPIPDSLRMLGISVELLDAQALAFHDLSRFDSIVTGNRAYELRADLPGANQRLLDYVASGGTLVVQYNTANSWDARQYAPYPTKIGNPPPRITDETSPVKFLRPEDSLLNRPNKITQNDFQGWVQERGLYFWKDFDAKYTPLLGMNDPGEPEQNGGLVYTKYGQGTYIYTGLAFFRQLPEGVPGAFRLFVNLLSASREK